jgi:CBS domain-containing protein
MHVKDIMTQNPVCCLRETSLIEVGRKMIDYSCGEIPVVENYESMIPVGVVTDRDIVCRTIGKGIDPMSMSAGEIMTTPVVTVMPEMDFGECCQLMEEKQIRRILVIDAGGSCCGIVSLADVARYTTKEQTGEILQEVSVEIGAASNVG